MLLYKRLDLRRGGQPDPAGPALDTTGPAAAPTAGAVGAADPEDPAGTVPKDPQAKRVLGMGNRRGRPKGPNGFRGRQCQAWMAVGLGSRITGRQNTRRDVHFNPVWSPSPGLWGGWAGVFESGRVVWGEGGPTRLDSGWIGFGFGFSGESGWVGFRPVISSPWGH